MAERDARAVQQTLVGFLTGIVRDPGLEREIAEDGNLFERGILDSMGVVQLVTFVEERFGIRMTESDLASPEFTHVRGLSEIILRRRSGDAEGRPGKDAAHGVRTERGR
jgi:acyl carrier protein